MLPTSLKRHCTYRALVDDQSNLVVGLDKGPALAKVVPDAMARTHVVKKSIVAIGLMDPA